MESWGWFFFLLTVLAASESLFQKGFKPCPVPKTASLNLTRTELAFRNNYIKPQFLLL